MNQYKLFALFAVVCTFTLAGSANAAIVSSITQVSADPSVVGDISNSDLINAGSGALSGVSSDNYSAITIEGQTFNSDPGAVLNDGLHGYRAGAENLAASSNPTWGLTYALTGAFDIDSIVVHSASTDNRIDQHYVLLFEFAGDPGNFVEQGTFDNRGFHGTGHWKVTIEDDNSAPIGTNVTGIRFTIFNGVVAPTVFSEIDVFEAGAVPEPSSFVLAGLGLLGLAGFGLRRRKG